MGYFTVRQYSAELDKSGKKRYPVAEQQFIHLLPLNPKSTHDIELTDEQKIKLFNPDDVYSVMQEILLREAKIDQEKRINSLHELV